MQFHGGKMSGENPMIDGIETAVRGWDKIAASIGWSIRTAQRRKEELQNAGVIFYHKSGRPPARKVFHFPSRLRSWVALKSSRGEYL
jgi:hypothetical protein